jgi:hypothetical protein
MILYGFPGVIDMVRWGLGGRRRALIRCLGWGIYCDSDYGGTVSALRESLMTLRVSVRRLSHSPISDNA